MPAKFCHYRNAGSQQGGLFLLGRSLICVANAASCSTSTAAFDMPVTAQLNLAMACSESGRRRTFECGNSDFSSRIDPDISCKLHRFTSHAWIKDHSLRAGTANFRQPKDAHTLAGNGGQSTLDSYTERCSYVLGRAKRAPGSMVRANANMPSSLASDSISMPFPLVTTNVTFECCENLVSLCGLVRNGTRRGAAISGTCCM